MLFLQHGAKSASQGEEFEMTDVEPSTYETAREEFALVVPAKAAPTAKLRPKLVSL